jgi:hypothetical protein
MDKDMKSAEDRERDELLAAVPEENIVQELGLTLARARRWYQLHKRPIVATDITNYINAFDAILILDRSPDGKPSSVVN